MDQTLIFCYGVDDPIILLGDNDSCRFEADDIGLHTESIAPNTGLSDSPAPVAASRSLVPPSSNGWFDIDDLPETGLRLPLTEQGASTSNSIGPYNPPPRLSSEPLHDSIGAMDLHPRRARSEATVPYSARPQSPLLHCARVSPEQQLSHYTGRGAADEHELVDHVLDTLLIDEGAREQEKDKGNSEDEDEGPQQDINLVAPMVTPERADRSQRPANRRQSLPNLDPSPEPSHNEAGTRSGGDSDDEFNSTDSAEDDEKKPLYAKRKQPSSPRDGSIRKKRRRPQESSSRQR